MLTGLLTELAAVFAVLAPLLTLLLLGRGAPVAAWLDAPDFTCTEHGAAHQHTLHCLLDVSTVAAHRRPAGRQQHPFGLAEAYTVQAST